MIKGMHSIGWRCAGICTFGLWIYLAFFRGGFWRFRERLRLALPRAGHSVTAIIPARDERDLPFKHRRKRRVSA